MVSAVAFVQSKARLVAMLANVMMMADLNSCERCDSSRSELMAASPATVSTTMNSNGCCSISAHISIMMTCVMNAVRESIKTRMNMGTMAYGSIYTCTKVLRTKSAVSSTKSSISA